MLIFTNKEQTDVQIEEFRENILSLRKKGNLTLVNVVSFAKQNDLAEKISKSGDIQTPYTNGDQDPQQIFN